MIENKIFEMLMSSDTEMIKLGIIMALNNGRDWCIENLCYSGHIDSSREYDVEKWAIGSRRFTLRTRDLDRMIFTKNGVAIIISGRYIHCRYVYQLGNKREYNIINLNNEPEDS